ncbi:hypothetical protein IM043_gp159 [Bacillus phage SPG24]|nr:hypothetical protein IM043_gp159 [Bacillus phage SPG24]
MLTLNQYPDILKSYQTRERLK